MEKRFSAVLICSSALTVTVLLQVLERFSKDVLPPTLYLQLNNCGKENKNKVVLSFLSLPIELKILDKVSV